MRKIFELEKKSIKIWYEKNIFNWKKRDKKFDGGENFSSKKKLKIK